MFFTTKNSNHRHKHAKWPPSDLTPWTLTLVSVQGVESLGGHFATLCQEFDSYEVKKYIIIQKEKGNTFPLLIIFTLKSLQKEQKSTNLLL